MSVLEVSSPADTTERVICEIREHVRWIREARPVLAGHEFKGDQIERWANRLETIERGRRKNEALDAACHAALAAEELAKLPGEDALVELFEACAGLVKECAHQDGGEYEDGEWLALDRARAALARVQP